MFESADSVHLLCCNQMGPMGRDVNANFVAANFGDTIDEQTMGRAYTDVSGSVVEYRFAAGPDEDRPAGGGDPVGYDEVQVSEHAADGSATRTIHAAALQILEAVDGDGLGGPGYFALDLAAASRITDRYLSAWSGRDGAAVGELYAEQATVLDSLLGVRLTGRDAIGAYAAEHGGARLREDSIPNGGGPALYGYWAGFQGPLTAYLSYVGDDGNQCPGGVTTELRIEQGQIVAERRYHDVASMRRCLDTTQLPDGWWTNAVIPPPIEDRVTGTVTTAGQRIEVHNGSGQANDLVRWAMARFATAKLSAPTISSIAFSEQAHRDQCSSGRWGVALDDGSSSRIYLCSAVEGTVTPFERQMLLHELAHAWIWQHLDESAKQSFVARLHLPSWDGVDVPWDRRGIEHAADVIAWGLSDTPFERSLTAKYSCADLAQSFQVLTGAAPLQPPCPSSG